MNRSSLFCSVLFRLALARAITPAIVVAASAQEKPYTQAGTGTPVPALPSTSATTGTESRPTAPAAPAEQNAVENFFNSKIPEAIAKGKFNLNVRLRYEWVDQSTFTKDAYAPTVRTRFGYTTAPLYGFQAM